MDDSRRPNLNQWRISAACFGSPRRKQRTPNGHTPGATAVDVGVAAADGATGGVASWGAEATGTQ